MCFADLDHFKDRNDRYGHHVGDKALAAVAAQLRASVRDHHCLVARIGGDEFVVLIPPPVSTFRTTVIADRLLSALDDPSVIDDHVLEISASIGVVVTSLMEAETESLLAAADASLYNAKANGKGHWVLEILDNPVQWAGERGASARTESSTANPSSPPPPSPPSSSTTPSLHHRPSDDHGTTGPAPVSAGGH